jgi:nitrile hydratase subunit beta
VNGVHDMGGMHGLGPIHPEGEDAPVFHHAWEARTHAMVLASPTRGNIDVGRHRRERIPGPDYLRMTYYEKWLEGLCGLLAEQGLVTAMELATGRADPAAAKAEPRLSAAATPAAMVRQGSYVRQVATAPVFAVGDSVRTLNLHPTGHTRLPRYVRGRTGVIVARHGAHVFPDSNAHDKGEDPRHLYTVSFSAQDLWGPPARAGDSVRLDLWEPYLERA